MVFKKTFQYVKSFKYVNELTIFLSLKITKQHDYFQI